jgi:hypothetical protein
MPNDKSATDHVHPRANGAAASPSPAPADLSLFDNLDQLRITDPALLGGDTEILGHLYVRRPKKDEFFRVNPDPAMTLTCLVWVDQEEGDVYFVGPEARDIMIDSAKLVTLVLCQSRQGVSFLWPVLADTRSGGGRGWAESARTAMVRGQSRWVKIRGDRSAGAYTIIEAAEQHGEPVWPSLSLNELLKLGFRDRLIISADHPIVRRLQGY